MKSKNLAAISLIVMGAGFIGTMFLPEHVAVILLHGGFEAGLVGGIADWFAVTALFRHPMGIPIPHTSLLLKNKTRIVDSIISSVENELLNKQSIEAKLKDINILQKGAALATKFMSRRDVRSRVLDMLIAAVQRIPLPQVVPHIQSGAAAYLNKLEVKELADSALTNMLRERYDEQAFDYVLSEAETWLRQRKTKLMLGQIASEKLADTKMRGFMGLAVQAVAGFMDEDKLGAMLQSMILSAVRDMQDSENENRKAILQELRIRMFELTNHEEYMDKLKSWLLNQLEEEQTTAVILAQLEQVRSLAVEQLEQEKAAGGRRLFAGYRWLIRRAGKEPHVVERGEQWIASAIIKVVEDNHYRIGLLIKENVDKLDDAALVHMLEDKIGKDLQWIRVNGALCGFIIGIVLSLFKLI